MLGIKSALVTGANRGIGLELVKQLVKQNGSVPVFATCRNPAKAEDLNRLVESNPNLQILSLDVTNYTQHQEVLERVKSVVGNDGLHMLVNNAGIFNRKTLNSLTAKDMIDHYEINAVAPLMIAKLLLPLLQTSSEKNNGALIVNISAIMASFSDKSPGSHYPYRCSKVALNMITKGLSEDLAKTNISCIALHPGWVKTDLGGKMAPLTPEASVSKMLKTLAQCNKDHNGKMLNFDGKIIPW